MTRRTIPWHRLLPRHQRLLVWWALAGLGIAAPWLIAGVDLPWLQRQASELPGCRVASVYDGDTLRVQCGTEKLKVRLHCIDAPEMQLLSLTLFRRNFSDSSTPGFPDSPTAVGALRSLAVDPLCDSDRPTPVTGSFRLSVR